MEYIQLNNGIKMPSIGFGVYQIPLLMTKQCVLDALAIGYRHIGRPACNLSRPDAPEAPY